MKATSEQSSLNLLSDFSRWKRQQKHDDDVIEKVKHEDLLLSCFRLGVADVTYFVQID